MTNTTISNPYIDTNNEYPYEVILNDNHENWLKCREKGLGGSDIASIIGYNPWKSNTQLFDEKVGNKKAKDISNNPNVKYGSEAEEYLRNTFRMKYKDRFELFYEPNAILVDKEYPFMRYSPDGLLYDKLTNEYGIWECKTSEVLRSTQREKWNNDIPTNYQCQVIHGLNITRFKFVVLRAELTYNLIDFDERKNGYTAIKDYYFHVDDENVKDNMKFLKGECLKFWKDNVEPNKRPSLKVTV